MTPAGLARIASRAVAAALRELPPEIRGAAQAVPVRLEHAPDDEGPGADLLGLFTGSPLGTEFSGDEPEPPRIRLFTAHLWEHAGRDARVFREEVRLTYLHELGHFLGWDEGQLESRGLG